MIQLLRKFLDVFVCLTLLNSCIGNSNSNDSKNSFFKVVSSSYVKEFCSCLFVEGQAKAYCAKYARQLLPVSTFKIDLSKKSVIATALGISSEAYYRNKKLGCRLK